MEPAPSRARVNRTTTQRFEQWALPRLAAALPRWVTPDHLTGLGLVAAGVIAAGYLLAGQNLDWLWLSSAAFVLHWYADSLDGTLARERRIQRERYGFYVDHQSDAVSTLVIFGGLGLSSLMQLSIALGVVVGYFLMMLLTYITTISRDVFKISFGGFGPTEVRLVVIAANTVVWALGNPVLEIAGWTGTLFDGLGVLAVVGLLITYVVTSLIERSRLAELDPPRTPAVPEAPDPERAPGDALA